MTPVEGVPPKLEIRIPISATENFLRMTRYFLESLQEFGGPIARRAHCVVSVSADMPYRDLHKECAWAADHSVEFRWVDQDLFDRYRYHGTAMHRFAVDSDADVILFSDADIFVAGDFDGLVQRAVREQAVLGWLAHWSPFVVPRHSRDTPSANWWRQIFDEADLPCPEMTHQHPGWGYGYHHPDHRYCPVHFNQGFYLAPRAFFDKTAATFAQDLDAVARIFDTAHKTQIALTLSIVRHSYAAGLTGLKYNCPTGIPASRLIGPQGGQAGNVLEDIRIFHYLAGNEISKRDFETESALEALLAKDDLKPSSKVMQRKIGRVRDVILGKDAPLPA